MENIILFINMELIYFLECALTEWRNKLLYILQINEQLKSDLSQMLLNNIWEF